MKDIELQLALINTQTNEEVDSILMRWCNSYETLPNLMCAYDDMDKVRWLSAIGRHWSHFDNIAKYKSELTWRFENVTREELDLMMNKEELVFYEKLPKTLEIYRGCYDFNQDGLSWSLDKEIAKGFISLNRYKQEKKIPLLVSGLASKKDVVIKLDRDEQEVIVFDVLKIKVLNTE
jgi:hypothetical protein